ncbi:MAG: adenylosuccinate synthase [Planctomycetota bacterium]
MNRCVIGAQWGDEGKARIVDLLAGRADVVVRYQGGANAGHTIVAGDRKFVLHLLPAGILHRGTMNVIGNGVVVDPLALISEIRDLRRRGVAVGRNLLLSDRAHVVMPYHKAVEAGAEARRAKGKIGSTGRGIGPCYSDKMARTGIRMADLLDPVIFRDRLRANVAEKNVILKCLYGRPPIAWKPVFEQYRRAARFLRPFVADTSHWIDAAARRGKTILFEGAQGGMLDIDHGTYPFVTSSSASVAGVFAGSGVGPGRLDAVAGVVKAYVTRVGAGPMPTEIHGPVGDRIREKGREYGATTGRPRRCGWFDAVAARYMVRVNGITELAVTKLDIYDNFEASIQVCTAYRLDGKRIEGYPADAGALERCVPVYEKWPGWSEDTSAARKFSGLPRNARRYIARLEDVLGARISMISVGPEREQIIFR